MAAKKAEAEKAKAKPRPKTATSAHNSFDTDLLGMSLTSPKQSTKSATPVSGGLSLSPPSTVKTAPARNTRKSKPATPKVDDDLDDFFNSDNWS